MVDRRLRGPGLLRRVRPGRAAAARPGAGGGAPLAGGGVLRGGQAGGRPGRLRGQELARLAPARHPGHAGARPARRAAGRPEQDKGGARAARQLLVPLSVPEVRRLITRLAPGRAPPAPAFVLAWSFWRRAHQAADSRAKRNGLSEADLDVLAKLLEQRLERGEEAEALPRRQV